MSSKMVHKEQPYVALSSGANARGHFVSRPQDDDNSSTNFSIKIRDVTPVHHEEQPSPEHVSKMSWQGVKQPAAVESWQSIIASYSACRSEIHSSPELQESRVGRRWLGIIDRRASWMDEDQTKLERAMDRNRVLTRK